MLEYEQRHAGKIIAGIDEAGRGPLYGPVVAAAVILAKGFDITGIDDSKKLTAKKRQALYDRITSGCIFGIGMATAAEIDGLNILNATKLACTRSVQMLEAKGERPEHLLIDHLKLADIDIDQDSIVRGDQKSASIAAASIIAKVWRDNLIIEDDKNFPEYFLARHKGYGTKAHLEALEVHGYLPGHRQTFLKKYGFKASIKY